MKIHSDGKPSIRLLAGIALAAYSFALCTAQTAAANKGGNARSADAKSDTAAPHGEIVWDTYGVPHVFAKNITGLFWGFGYAQMQGHGDLLLRLLEIFERVLVPLAELHGRILKTAFEEKIGQRFHQVFGAEAEIVTGVARVADRLH